MISQDCRGITFLEVMNWRSLRGARGGIQLKRDISAFFLG